MVLKASKDILSTV